MRVALLLLVVVACVALSTASHKKAADKSCDQKAQAKVVREGWQRAYCNFFRKKRWTIARFARRAFNKCSPDPKKKKLCFNRRGVVKCIFQFLIRSQNTVRRQLKRIAPVCRQRLTRNLLDRNGNRCIKQGELRRWLKRNLRKCGRPGKKFPKKKNRSKKRKHPRSKRGIRGGRRGGKKKKAADKNCDQKAQAKVVREGWQRAYCNFFRKKRWTIARFARRAFNKCSPDPKKKKLCFNRRGVVKCIFQFLIKSQNTVRRQLKRIAPVCRQRLTRNLLDRNGNRCIKQGELRRWLKRNLRKCGRPGKKFPKKKGGGRRKKNKKH